MYAVSCWDWDLDVNKAKAAEMMQTFVVESLLTFYKFNSNS